MKKPETPKSEARRLETLRSLNVLDTAAEERFDRVTRMAQRLFQVPIALVSLVDANRQWFKSRCGLDATETPRDISFCGHAILHDTVFHIPDARSDLRFADNPLVTGPPNIRFYAGQPLTASNGERLGTLCVIDEKPRDLSEDDREALADLASLVEQELEALQLATQDDLTHIPNRRGFTMLAQHSLNICRREQKPAALVYFDLNGFKLINDTYGHQAGDSALELFATGLQNCFRDSDVCGRLGGDEFVALLGDADAELAESIIVRLRRELTHLAEGAALPFEIRFSSGIREYNADRHDSIQTLMSDADAAMYDDKRAGRDAMDKAS